MQDIWLTGQPDSKRRISFTLPSGRLIWVVTFGYSGTYDGLLEGRPNAKMNKEIVDEQLKAAQLRTWDKMFLFTPETRVDDDGAVHLPPLCCNAELMSSPLSQEMHGSSLIVVWFTPPFFNEPLASFIARSMQELPWELHAKDFEF